MSPKEREGERPDVPRWQQVWEVFEAAIAQPPEAQPAFLDEACGGDEKLRRGVEDLLRTDRDSDSFLDHPIGGAAGAGGAVPELLARSVVSGTLIGPYRILRRIGQGGMGSVYLAVRADDSFRRQVVLKLVRPGMESRGILDRLRTERQILAGLAHPYIARLYDGGTTDEGLPYFVLEYIEGVSIDVYCEQNQLSVDDRLTLLRKVCEAVDYAHRNLVIHRDLKPSNILVTADGVPKLLDFGIAKLLNPELTAQGLESTATWQRILTPSYASPEQIRGQPVTTASDVYSLGVLLYKLLTGRLPYRFEGRSAFEIESILTESEPLPPSVAVTSGSDETQLRDSDEPPAARRGDGGQPERSSRRRALRRQLSGDLDAIVLKALRSVPQTRYSSVEQLAADLERYQRRLPVDARAGSWIYRTGKFVRRHRTAWAAAAVLLVLGAGFLVATVLQTARVARERDQKAQVLALIVEVFRAADPYVVSGGELTVRQALERSVPLFREALDDQPEVRAELLHTSGSILGTLGVLEPALEQLEEARRLRGQLGDTADDAATLTALAGVHKMLGDLDRAEEMARQAVETTRDLDPASPAHAAALNQLVSVLCFRSQYEAAEEPAAEALALTLRLPEKGAQRIAALEQLALVRSSQGQDREAVQLYREAIALRRTRYGEHHPAQIATLGNLGLNLRRLEELEAAESTYREALSLQRENFGEERIDPYLLNNLGGLLLAKGEPATAEDLFREARETVVKGAGPRHWMVFFFELRIAQARLDQGAWAETEETLRRLLPVWTGELGEHWRLDLGRQLLGESLSLQGKCDQADPLLIEGFENLIEKAGLSIKQRAFQRLREHLERCGRAQDIAGYEAMLEAAGG